jgi:FkbM family methyltransferase
MGLATSAAFILGHYFVDPMPFVSYAQNFEDVMLWRALGHVQTGFYIDVGAWSPDQDSVTRAFSERGWRGINIEPNPAYFCQLVERRPSDVNLCVALGDRCGTVPMNFIADSGLSTANEEIAHRHAASGWVMTEHPVALRTLASIWDRDVPPSQDVHFLKIDVEGLERDVLAGNDWTRHRPWVVVVEATYPNSQVESYGDWEHLLLQAGYDHVYSDGLNRYYVAHERAQLKEAFRNPPNVFDGFVMAEVQMLRESLIRREADMAAAQERVVLAEASAIDARHRERRVRASANVERGQMRRAIADRDRSIAEASVRIGDLTEQQRALQSSHAWRAAMTLQRMVSVVPGPVLKYGKRTLKLSWWMLTPWRIPERLRFMRERRAGSATGLDLSSDVALHDAAGMPPDLMLWARQSPQEIIDKWSAARFVIDLLRTRPDVRAQFPTALSAPKASGFADWLACDKANALGLSELGLQMIDEILREDPSTRARQLFLFRGDIRIGLPHGLTPPGHAGLFRWFMRHGRQELDLRSEEIMWLFMQAAENPALEIVWAYLFTPDWQKRHPDAMTVFGRDAFAKWYADTYKLGDEGWLVPSNWPPVATSASRQLREAYWARSDWQASHPGAFESVAAARSLVEWLRSGQVSLSADARAWCAALDPEKTAEELVRPGMNVIGHFCSPSGVRVSAESLVAGMRSEGIQTSLRDLRTDILDEPNHVRFDGLEDFDVTLIHTQPDPFFLDAYVRSDLQERTPATYRIAYWYWEFDSIPEGWVRRAEGVDEVWAATSFVAKGLRERLPVPVVTMFPGVQLGNYVRRDRSYFGVEEDTFMFLFNFHMNSVMERKNPLGLIRAFKAAFSPHEPASLVVKTMYGHHHPGQMMQLRDAAAGARIQLIDEMYSPDEVLSLTDACDAYVSLHRSEGLGLTLSEAMLMGKPVIATGFSGNVDFMDDSNSLLVSYELVRLGRSMPPYDPDLVWAEPSVDHAASLMRRLYEGPEFARELGARAKVSAESRLSVRAAGQRVARRLAEIKALRTTGK